MTRMATYRHDQRFKHKNIIQYNCFWEPQVKFFSFTDDGSTITIYSQNGKKLRTAWIMIGNTTTTKLQVLGFVRIVNYTAELLKRFKLTTVTENRISTTKNAAGSEIIGRYRRSDGQKRRANQPLLSLAHVYHSGEEYSAYEFTKYNGMNFRWYKEHDWIAWLWCKTVRTWCSDPNGMR